ncbi:LysR family transcriptional regulator [Enemella evansiae]|nr:LysR family transcriptional regulator [Enemella evansiae]OYO03651.1 LysR family transcriptional regulator [Enemella evansiae]
MPQPCAGDTARCQYRLLPLRLAVLIMALMQLERLQYFVALAEELHFSRAAERLQLSQPALSQQVKRLERQLGVQLCERGPHGVTLTAAGQRLADGARDLVTSYEALIAEVTAVGHGEAGVLRIAHTRSDGAAVARAALASFGRQHPGVEVRAEVGWTAWNLDRLVTGDLDAAIVRTPIERPGLRVEPLAESEVVAVLPTGHRLARSRRIRSAWLLEEAVLCWPRRQAPAAHAALLTQLFGTGPFPALHDEPDADHLLAAVAEGAGIGLLDRARVPRRRGLLMRRFTAPEPHLGIGLAWRPDHPSPQLRALLATLRRA